MSLNWFARQWAVDDRLPLKCDLVAFASFGANDRRLSWGSWNVITTACRINKSYYPDAKIAFGEFTLNPLPGLEERLKRAYFPQAIFAGRVLSTIEEAEQIRAHLPQGFVPRSIVFVTDEWHSPSAKLVWRKVWADVVPTPDIYVVSVRSDYNIDEYNPMWPMRKHWTWALSNILRHAFLVCVPFGFELMKKLNIHQPT